MRRILILFKITIMLFLGSVSCDAPHLNPLDPENPNDPVGVIEGTVKTVKLPRSPISDVVVTWELGSTVVGTDAEGRFQINSLEKENGWVSFQKEGYSVDSQYVDWQNTSKITVESFLNSIPKIDSLIFTSTTRNYFPEEQKFDLTFEAGISDDENDIDSVFIKNEELTFIDVLEYNPSSRFYELFIPNDNLEFSSIEQIIGKEFDIIVKDNLGKEFLIGSSNIKRIIKDQITVQSPNDGELVSIPFFLRWIRFEPGFNFYYKIEVYTDDILQTLVLDIENISMSEVNYEITSQLSSGEYFWIIWCIDEFGNMGSSRPATFEVN
ncbi:MAG: hypothetical protein PVH88_20725 [Ignavibacteria bacterium]|jgi:hypothetical protein